MSLLSQFYPSGGGGGVPADQFPSEVVVVSGGGLGAPSAWAQWGGGHGGAGRVEQGFFNLELDKTYPVTVGGASGGSSFGQAPSQGKGGGRAGGGYQPSLPSLGGSGGGQAPVAFTSELYSLPGESIEHVRAPSSFAVYANTGGAQPNDNYGGGALGNGNGSHITFTITGAGTSVGEGGWPNVAAVANTGNGGRNGGQNGPGLPGQSGTVIIAYPTDYNAASTSGTVVTPSRPGYRVYRFNSSGTFSVPS